MGFFDNIKKIKNQIDHIESTVYTGKQSLLEVYERIEKLLRDYTFDTSLNKGDDVENTILKLEGIFTKEHIRKRHPFVSDSTIDRTLKKLRDENVIKPLSTGRSAKWIKIAEPIKNDAFSKITQLGLFEGDFDE